MQLCFNNFVDEGVASLISSAWKFITSFHHEAYCDEMSFLKERLGEQVQCLDNTIFPGGYMGSKLLLFFPAETHRQVVSLGFTGAGVEGWLFAYSCVFHRLILLS